MSSRMTSSGIIITQGDTLNIPLIFAYNRTDGVKVPINLENAVLRMQVRPSADAQPVIQKEIRDHVDAANGRTVMQLTPEDTNIAVGTYYTDMEIQFIDGQKFTFYPYKTGCNAYFKVVEQFTKGD